MGSKSEATLRLRSDKAHSELFDLHSDLRAVERRIRVLGCRNVGGKSRVVQRELREAHEHKGRILGQIRAAQNLLDSLTQQMSRNQQAYRGLDSRSGSTTSGSHTAPSPREQLAWRPEPAKEGHGAHPFVSTLPRYPDESEHSSMAVHSASTHSHRPQSSHADLSNSGYLAPTLLPASSGAEAADAPSRRTCTVATSMGNFPAACASELSAQAQGEEHALQYQQTSRPWKAAALLPPAAQYEDTRVTGTPTSPVNIGRMVSRQSAVANPHGPRATFLSDIDSPSPYTDVSVPEAAGPECRSAVVHSWLDQHASSIRMQGPGAFDPLPSDDAFSDVPHSASLDTFLHQEVPLYEQPPSNDTYPMQHHLSAATSPHQRRSLSIFDCPQEQAPDGDTAAGDIASAYPQTDTEISKIERWLRAVGKSRGWDLRLLDDLLTQNLAAVLANDTTAEAQHAEESSCSDRRSNRTRISQMNPRSNPIALQAFVSQFGLPSTEQHQSERYDASKGDHTATTVPGTFGRGLQRGTADTLVQAARTHLLHRSGPATVHPHAHLLHQSFELLEGRGTHVEECPSFAKETRVVSPTAAPCQHSRPRSGRCLSKSRGASGGRSCTLPKHAAANHTAGTTGREEGSGTHVSVTGRGRAADDGDLKGGKGLVKATMDARSDSNIQGIEGNIVEDTFGRSSSPSRRIKCNRGLPVAGSGAIAMRSRKAGTNSPPDNKMVASRTVPQTPVSTESDGNFLGVGEMWPLTRSVEPMGGQQGNEHPRPEVGLSNRQSIKSHRLVFEEGELEAIEAGLDTSMDWKVLVRLQAQYRDSNVCDTLKHGHLSRHTRDGGESSKHEVPILSRCPEPNTICGRPASRTQSQHEKAARSALLIIECT